MSRPNASAPDTRNTRPPSALVSMAPPSNQATVWGWGALFLLMMGAMVLTQGVSADVLWSLFAQNAWAAGGVDAQNLGSSLMSDGRNLFTPNPNDISLIMLRDLFGTLFTQLGMEGGADPMIAPFAEFSSGLVVLAGVFVGYSILKTGIQTAQDGEMPKSAKFWMPLRTSGAIAVLAPVYGGYCVMQLIVIYLVAQGVGFADRVWVAYMKDPVNLASIQPTITGKSKIRRFVEDVYMSNVCVVAHQAVLGNKNSESESPDLVEAALASAYKYGVSQDMAMNVLFGEIQRSPDSCAKFSLLSIPKSTKTEATGKYGFLNGSFTSIDTSPILRAQNEAAVHVIEKTHDFAEKSVTTAFKVANNGLSSQEMKGVMAYTDLSKIADEYIKEVTLAAGVVAKEDPFKEIMATAQEEGWALAGAWYFRLAKMQASVADAMNSTPSVDLRFKAGAGDTANRQIATIMDLSVKVIEDAPSDQRGADAFADRAKATQIEGTTISSLSTWSWSNAMNRVGAIITDIDLKNLVNDTRHPLVIMGDLGHRLLIAYSATFAFLGGMSLLAGAAATQVVLTALFVPLTMILTMAFFLEYFLPMLPYTIWLGVFFGWVVQVVQSIIAAPIWAVTHLVPDDGDNMMGAARNGYNLMLGLILRPVLMVLGLITSISLMAPMGTLVNKTFFEAFAISQGNTDLGLFQTVFGIAIYAGVMYTLVQAVFSTIHKIPDEIMQWATGTSFNLGGSGSELSQGAQGMHSNIADKVGSIPGNALNQGSGVKNAMDNQKAHKDQAAAQTAQERLSFDQAHGLGAAGLRDSVVAAAEAGATASKWGSAGDRAAKEAAYSSGIASATQHGGQSGAAEYESKMTAAAENGFADYGGSFNAASESIASGIASNAMLSSAENIADPAGNSLGSAGSNYMSAVASNGAGGISPTAAKDANNALGRMASRIGAPKTAEILDKAVAMGGTPAEVRQLAKAGYAAAKAEMAAAGSGGGGSSSMYASGSGDGAPAPAPEGPPDIVT